MRATRLAVQPARVELSPATRKVQLRTSRSAGDWTRSTQRLNFGSDSKALNEDLAYPLLGSYAPIREDEWKGEWVEGLKCARKESFWLIPTNLTLQFGRMNGLKNFSS
eukprot:scaffold6861_cov248-Ochromonas_danica.AAC.15